MNNNLEMSLSVIPDDMLNDLFKDLVPNEETKNEGNNISKEVKVQGKTGINVPLIEDAKELFKEETPEEKTTRETKEAEDKKKESVETPEQKTAREATEKADAEAKKAKEDAEKNKPEAEAVSEILTNTVNYLVEKKIFKDFENREGMKFTEELYAELLEKQLDHAAEERYISRKKATGEYGEAIIDYIENGGDPDQVIDLFKEQKAIQEFDTSTDEGKKDLVIKWYKEVHGWKSERIQKEINNLLAEEGALEAEAQDIKAKYKAQYDLQLEELRQTSEEDKRARTLAKREFEKDITKVIDSNTEFDDKRKKFIKDSIFKTRKTTDGGVVNDAYIKFLEYQSDPEKYVRLIDFILDEEGFIKRKEAQIQNKTTEKQFNFIKGNAATSKTKGSKHEELDKKQSVGTNFSFI